MLRRQNRESRTHDDLGKDNVTTSSPSAASNTLEQISASTTVNSNIESAKPDNPTSSTTNPTVMFTATSTAPTKAGNAASNSGTASAAISKGTLAGSIVGTAIIAALIAATLTWLAMRRRRRHVLSTPSAPQLEKQQKRASTDGRGARAWEQHLPQPADDRVVNVAFSTLVDQLEVHVENHYRDRQRLGEEGDKAALLAIASPHLPGSLPALMTHQAHRPRTLIKHCLTNLALNPDPFLPPCMTALLHISDDPNLTALPQALSRCRVLSAYVHHPVDEDPASHERRAAAVAAAADSFEAAFWPWMSPSAPAGRRQNLTAIFESAADFHLMLFAQPCSYKFDWVAHPDVVQPVVRPGLDKMSDEDGNPLPVAQIMVPLAVIEHL